MEVREISGAICGALPRLKGRLSSRIPCTILLDGMMQVPEPVQNPPLRWCNPFVIAQFGYCLLSFLLHLLCGLCTNCHLMLLFRAVQINSNWSILMGSLLLAGWYGSETLADLMKVITPYSRSMTSKVETATLFNGLIYKPDDNMSGSCILHQNIY